MINTVWKRYIRGEVTDKDVEKVSEQLLALINKGALILLNQEAYITIATKIAVDNRITVYDSLFIAAYRDKLLTFDDKQLEVAERLGVRVVKLTLLQYIIR